MTGVVARTLGALTLFAALTNGETQTATLKWWTHPDTVARLRLTSNQTEALDLIFVSGLPERRRYSEEIRTLTIELEKLLDAPVVTEAQVARLSERLETVKGRRNTARTLMLFRMYNVLSADQRRTLKVVQEQLRRSRDPVR